MYVCSDMTILYPPALPDDGYGIPPPPSLSYHPIVPALETSIPPASASPSSAMTSAAAAPPSRASVPRGGGGRATGMLPHQPNSLDDLDESTLPFDNIPVRYESTGKTERQPRK